MFKMRLTKVAVGCLVIAMVMCFGLCFNLTEVEESLNETKRSFDVFTEDLVESARKRRKKGKYNMLPMIFGALMLKSIIFPLAFKGMAVMTGIAVLVSTMSLIISSIIGYAKLGWQRQHRPAIKVIHVNDGWAKEDDFSKGSAPEIEYITNTPANPYSNAQIEQYKHN